MADETTIVVPGLSRLDAVDLAGHQQAFGGAEIEERHVDDESVGVLDPVTAVVFTLGALGIQGFIAWLLKDKSSDVVEHEVIVRAVAAGDAEGARLAALDHITGGFGRYTTMIETDPAAAQ